MTSPPRIPFARPMIGVRLTALTKDHAAHYSFDDTLVNGPLTHKVEEQFAAYVGVKHAVAVSSCTAGLQLALMAINPRPQHYPLIPALTHVATAHAFELYLGSESKLGVEFVDVSPQTGNAVEDGLGWASNAGWLLVHFLGQPAVLEREYDFIIEDCAHALGATGVGQTCGVFSFYPSKHLTTGEGGMVTTNDSALAADIRARRAFGYTQGPEARSLPGLYDVDRLGGNYRMTEMQAALGLAQMPYLNERLEVRRSNFRRLAGRLEPLTGIERVMGGPQCAKCRGTGRVRYPVVGNHWPPIEQCRSCKGIGDIGACFCLNVVLSDALVLTDRTPILGNESSPFLSPRDWILRHLTEAGIGATVHYATPVPLLTYYREKYGYTPGDFPVAESLARRSISLPVGPHLSGKDMDVIADAMEEALG